MVNLVETTNSYLLKTLPAIIPEEIMKVLDIDYTMSLEFSNPVINHYFILRCVPVSRGSQTVTARLLTIDPSVTLKTNRDIFGNISYRGYIKDAHNKFSFKATATVQVNNQQGSREPCISLYKYPTPLTSVSEQLSNFLIKTFSETEFEQALKNKKIQKNQILSFSEKLCSDLHEWMEYKPGTTNVRTTAAQAFEQKQGVCQDFAHIFCSLCRHAGIAARYICGTSKGEGSTHAWAEVFVPDEDISPFCNFETPGRWYGFDPTRNKRCNNEYVILAAGRDYNDCQVDRGIFRGNADQTQTVFVKTTETEVPDYVAPAGIVVPTTPYIPAKPHEQ